MRIIQELTKSVYPDSHCNASGRVIFFALPYHQTSLPRLFSSKTWKIKWFNLTNNSGPSIHFIGPRTGTWNPEDVNSQRGSAATNPHAKIAG